MRIAMNKYKTFLLILLLSAGTEITAQDFITGQKKYARVRNAINEKEELLRNNLQEKEFTLNNFHLLIVVFKQEQELILYAAKKDNHTFQPIAHYRVCALSGNPGPKRRQGDGQIPEGFYFIDRFNPTSNYHLSLGINYPNESDRKKSPSANLGGDIFIHGDCVTIGCLPMTDDKIKEIYLYAIHARNNGQQKIPVYIFPYRMTETNFNRYCNLYKENDSLIAFWTNLRQGFLRFENDRKPLPIKISAKGDYIF